MEHRVNVPLTLREHHTRRLSCIVKIYKIYLDLIEAEVWSFSHKHHTQKNTQICQSAPFFLPMLYVGVLKMCRFPPGVVFYSFNPLKILRPELHLLEGLYPMMMMMIGSRPGLMSG